MSPSGFSASQAEAAEAAEAAGAPARAEFARDLAALEDRVAQASADQTAKDKRRVAFQLRKLKDR